MSQAQAAMQAAAKPDSRPTAGRVEWIELARAVGILLVVAGHTLVGPIATVIFHFHMPLFFMLSGTVFSTRPIAEWISRRTSSLLVPYIAWAVTLSALGVTLRYLGFPGAPGVQVKALLIGGEWLRGWFGTFWFVTCLFGALASYNILRLRFDLTRPALVILMAASAVVGIVLAPHALPWTINAVPIAVVLLWIGELCRRRRPPRWFVLPAAAAGVIGLLFGAPLDLKHGNLGTPGLSLPAAVALSYCIFELSQWAALKLGRRSLIHQLAAGSLVIMFVHQAIQISIRSVAPEVVVFLAATVGSLGVYWGVNNMGRWPRRVFAGR